MSGETATDKMIVIQLSEHDVYRVLYLIQREARDGTIWNDYWQGLAEQVSDCIEANYKDFFQCIACRDHQI